MAMWTSACLLLLLAVGASAQVDDDCVATALAATTSGEAASEAVSNAFAETLTESIICEDGSAGNPDALGGISVAVALAISEANTIGQTCAADAEAAAEFTTEFVTDGLESGLVGAAGEGDNETLAMAWFETQRGEVMGQVAQAPSFLNDEGCLDLTALANGLPSAISLGQLLSSAVDQILTAVQCGSNVVPTDEPCRWENMTYFGRCLTEGPNAFVAPAPAVVMPVAQSVAPLPGPPPAPRATSLPKAPPPAAAMAMPAPMPPAMQSASTPMAATAMPPPATPTGTITVTTTPTMPTKMDPGYDR